MKMVQQKRYEFASFFFQNYSSLINFKDFNISKFLELNPSYFLVHLLIKVLSNSIYKSYFDNISSIILRFPKYSLYTSLIS
jgi:hypothetical protein